ncbi:hypothetical protein LTR62_001536 [Meristemomyces frigidus]|uniref:Peptidase A1 domain-containing protein n=1 Tax=Meristemomyces frigidus TaxID=1508187 RepID=A0AAN7THB8_9PEZI|nr:hypothetical protein LTR62_001536 [Meristemomyces frigidus]
MPSNRGLRSPLPLTAILSLSLAHSSAATALTAIRQYGSQILEASLVRRQEQNSTVVAAPISIAPSQYWDGIDGPWSSFALQVGTPAQNVRVFVSTAAPITWTIGADGCPPGFVDNCANSRGFLFLRNESLTWIQNSIFDFQLEQNLNMDTNGNAGFDTATLGWQGAGGPSVQHSTLFNVASDVYWLGAFGVNPQPTNFTTFTDPQPSFMTQLVRNNSIPSLSYGYTAGNQYRLNKVFGSLTLGGYDSNRFGSNNITVDMYADVSRDLLVYVQGITSGSTNLLPGGTISMYIDSTVAMIWLPTDACKAFEQAFGLVWDSTYNLYLLNSTQRTSLVNTNPSVTFQLSANETGGDTLSIELPYSAFDLQVQYPIVANPNTSYYFPLQRGNNTQYTLGRTFLQEAYIIVDYERHHFKIAPCTWNQNAIQNPDIRAVRSTNSTRNGSDSNNSSGVSAGLIAGVVVAIVVIIAILAGILWFFRRRKNTVKRTRAELEAKEAGGAAQHSSDAENKPFISAPMGGELGGGEIHELTAPHKPFASEMESPHNKVIDPNKAGYSEMGAGEEYFGPGKGFAHEMQGSEGPVYEMVGSDVHEMAAEQVTERPKGV